MKLRAATFIAAAVLLAGLQTACSRGPRVIPAGKFEDLLEDMYVADQLLRDDSKLRDSADTSLFFDPILLQHGYTYEDYDFSINYYVDHPEDYSKILDNVYKRLKAQADLELELQNEAVEDAVRRSKSGYQKRDFEKKDTLSLKQYELFKQIRLQHLFGESGSQVTGNTPLRREAQEFKSAEGLLLVDGLDDPAQ